MSDARARVYLARGQVYGCGAGHATAFLLGERVGCLRGPLAGPFALVGARVAYGLDRCGVDTGSSMLTVQRLDTGQVLISRPALSRPVGVESYTSISRIVLSRGGAVAWIASGHSIGAHRQRTEVEALDRHGARVLDSGATIATGSLSLSGSTVRWRDGGRARSARLG